MHVSEKRSEPSAIDEFSTKQSARIRYHLVAPETREQRPHAVLLTLDVEGFVTASIAVFFWIAEHAEYSIGPRVDVNILGSAVNVVIDQAVKTARLKNVVGLLLRVNESKRMDVFF